MVLIFQAKVVSKLYRTAYSTYFAIVLFHSGDPPEKSNHMGTYIRYMAPLDKSLTVGASHLMMVRTSKVCLVAMVVMSRDVNVESCESTSIDIV